MNGIHDGMPPTGRRFGIQQVRFVSAHATRVYQLGGRQYIDAHLAEGAGGWTGIPVMELGGGEGRFMHVPIAGDQGEDKPIFATAEDTDPTDVASAQVWLFFDGKNTDPICVGAVPHSKRNLVTDTPETGDNEDRSADIGVNDFAAVNGGGRIVLDSRGFLALDPADGQNANTQLGDDNYWRISKGGNAGERLALGRKLTQHLRDITDVRASFANRLTALESAVTTLFTFLGAGPAVVGGGSGSLTPLTDTFTKANAQSEPASVDDTMLASAIRISDDEEPAGIA